MTDRSRLILSRLPGDDGRSRGIRPLSSILLVCLTTLVAGVANGEPSYPPSTAINGITFDMSTLKEMAFGSDNWTITWADDGHQYTSWGDGGGFGGDDTAGRVSFGVGRVEGTKNDYVGMNVHGGVNPESSSFDLPGGKSLGIISIDLSASGGSEGTLYMFRGGTGSLSGAFRQSEIFKSYDHGNSWTFTGVGWYFDRNESDGFFSPTFLQFGQDYAGARDNYVYIYANERTQSVSSDDWNVQRPGRISLLRVPKSRMDSKSNYEYFAGLDGDGNPQWSFDINDRSPAFADANNGIMRTSVSYNEPLKRYILVTQHVSRFRSENYHMGIYEAPEPWGPWSTIFFGNPETDLPEPLNHGSKTVYWNFSNKWLSSDGLNFVMVYTGAGLDNWGTVEGSFSVGASPPVLIAPAPPRNLVVH